MKHRTFQYEKRIEGLQVIVVLFAKLRGMHLRTQKTYPISKFDIQFGLTVEYLSSQFSSKLLLLVGLN